MQKLNWLSLSVLLLCSVSTTGIAQSCEHLDAQCSQQKIQQLTQQMKQEYQVLKLKVTRNQQKVLQYSQMAWLAQRDQACGQYSDTSTHINCHVDALVQRKNWLTEQVAICETQSCQTITSD